MTTVNERITRVIEQAMEVQGANSIADLSKKIDVGESTLKNWRNSADPTRAKAHHLKRLSDSAGWDLGELYRYLETGDRAPKNNALVDPRIARAKNLISELLYLFDAEPSTEMKPITKIIKTALEDLGLQWNEGDLIKALAPLPDANRIAKAILFEQYSREDIAKIAGALSEALGRDISVEAMLLAWKSGNGGARGEIASNPVEQSLRRTEVPAPPNR